MPNVLSERALIGVVGGVQFVNVLDFMMVMPLGPDFADDLGIATSALGVIGGAYTFAAALSALLCAFFLDRLDRRIALGLAMLGLSLATFGGALAWDLSSLIAMRVLAGIFGGPASSVAIAIVIDAVPPERRGRTLGAVMGAFSLASILGVPAGLELAHWGTWRTPFYAVGGLSLLVTAVGVYLLPPMTGHIARARSSHVGRAFLALLQRPEALAAYAMVMTTMMAVFFIVPNLAAYVQLNLGYPREHMGFLYLTGGIGSFFILRLCGSLTDRIGALKVAIAGTALYCVVIALFFIAYWPVIPVVVLFAGIMIANSIRTVPMTTVATHVPDDHERASFMSLRSCVQHLGCSAGAGLSSVLLTTGPGGALRGTETIGALAIGFSLALPPLVLFVERRLRARRP